MAKARETTAPDPPVESEEEESGDEEEEEPSEEENQGSESESEPEGPTANAKKPPISAPAPASKKPESQTGKSQTSAPESSSSEEEDSGSDTDTDSPPKKADPSIKPIASKPMSEPEKPTATTKKPRSKPNASSGPVSPTRSATNAGAKRPAPAATAPSTDSDTKRSKRKLAENSEKKGNPSDEGKKLFVRVWSEDDELAILRGMIDYSAKKKADPVADLNAFHEFIKSKINIDVSRTQLQDKIRRLRKKYENNAGKEKNGKERTFTNPHEQKAYDLSKKIWGTKKTVGEETLENPKANGTAVRKSRSKGAVGTTQKIEGAEEEVKEEKCLVSEKKKSVSFVFDGKPIDGWVFTEGMEFMEEDDRVEMEEKWRQFRKEEAGLLVKKLELSLEHAKKVFNGL